MLDSLPDRVRSKIAVNGNCWEWTAALTNNGYGRLKFRGKTVVAHKAVYLMIVGKIENGMTLDHKCRNRKCVNPDHLEQVTMRVNVLRGETITARNAQKTHCHKGHPLTGSNLFVRRDGRRRCKTCEANSQRRLQQKPGAKERHAAYERNRRAKLREREAMKEVNSKILAEGEQTGHAHRATAKTARVFEHDGGRRTLSAPRGTKVVHEEHKPITVPPGEFERTIVQEFDPFAEEVRQVRD